MPLVTAKSSTIFISIGSDTKVYHSLFDVPPPMLQRLHEIMSSRNTATILIADKRGQEELALIAARRGQEELARVLAASTVGRSRLAEAIRVRSENEPVRRPRVGVLRWGRRWLELLIPLAMGATLWALMELRF